MIDRRETGHKKTGCRETGHRETGRKETRRKGREGSRWVALVVLVGDSR